MGAASTGYCSVGLVEATHEHIHSSESGVAQHQRFWQTWLVGGPPKVIDPLAE